MYMRLNSKGVGRQILGGLIELPRASKMAGISFSDLDVSWVALDFDGRHFRVMSHGSITLPERIISEGLVRDINALADILGQVKRSLGGIRIAHITIPDEIAYIFEMQLPLEVSRESAKHFVEFELGKRLDAPVENLFFDFENVPGAERGRVAVGAFPRTAASEYVDALKRAGIGVSSVEIAARAAARAVASHLPPESVALLIDMLEHRTNVTRLRGGVPVASNSIGIPERESDRALALAHAAQDRQRLALSRRMNGVDDEPASRIILTGPRANRKAVEVIAEHATTPTHIGDVWQDRVSFADHVPGIPREKAQAYAAALGTLLRAFGEQGR